MSVLELLFCYLALGSLMASAVLLAVKGRSEKIKEGMALFNTSKPVVFVIMFLMIAAIWPYAVYRQLKK